MYARRVAAAALLLVWGLVGAAQAAPPAEATLRPGHAAFWGYHEASDYRVVVRPGGWRLRVAYDHPDFRQSATGRLLDPTGKQAATLSGWDSGEAYVLNPRVGTWVLRMDVQYPEVRFRAKLERAPAPAPRKAVPLLPNLRLVPPHELTMGGVAGTGQGTCNADDLAEQHAIRCLRFSIGPANVGVGPLQLEFPGNQGLATPGQATQLLDWSDGHVTRRGAGAFEYHKTHAHYHHSGFGRLELLRVDDPARGTMTHVGDGPKQGFCTADVKISEWSVFGGVQNSAASTCLDRTAGGMAYDPTAGTRMGLSPGWADLYSWEQDGNYVELGTSGDGRYVVRSTADALGKVLESDESDNTSYAYLTLSGTTITVLERGRGQSPWDPKRVVVHDGLHPTAA